MKEYVYIGLLFVLMLFACGKRGVPFPDEETAEALLRDNPDSLSVWLEEGIDPTDLTDSLKAEYGWWITRLHERQGRSLMNDSLIHHTLDYFREHTSPRLSYAYVLAGMQRNWAGDAREEETRYMEEGWKIAESRRDTAWAIDVGRILAHVYFVSNDSRSALEVDKKILRYVERIPRERMHVLYAAGCCYARLGETDSMRICLEEAIRLSRELEDRSELYITRNYIDALNSAGRSEEAAPLLERFRERFPAETFMDSLAIDFAQISLWLNTGRMDSIQSSLERLERYEERVVRSEYRNKYRSSFVYISRLLRAACDVKNGRPVDLVGIYGTSEMVADWEAGRMSIERERALTQIRLERSNLLLKIKEEIERIGQENDWLQKEKQRLQQEMDRLSAILVGQDEYLKRLRKGEFKHLSDIDWPSVYKTLDRLFNHYTKRLRKDYPGLTEEDIQCCCLIKLRLSTSAIASLYGIAPSSVTKRKQRIKERMKQAKTGLIGKELPIDVFLWGY